MKKPENPKFFEEIWADLEEKMPQVTPDEKKHMRNMFFIGAWTCFRVMCAVIGISKSDEEPTEEDLTRMAWLNEELVEFMNKLGAEYGKLTIH